MFEIFFLLGSSSQTRVWASVTVFASFASLRE